MSLWYAPYLEISHPPAISLFDIISSPFDDFFYRNYTSDTIDLQRNPLVTFDYFNQVMGDTPPESLPDGITGQYIESVWDSNGRQRVFHRRYANSDTETTTWDTDDRDDSGNVIKKIETLHHDPQHPTDFTRIWNDNSNIEPSLTDERFKQTIQETDHQQPSIKKESSQTLPTPQLQRSSSENEGHVSDVDENSLPEKNDNAVPLF